MTDYGYEHDRVINRGIDPRHVEERTGRRVRVHSIVDRDGQRPPARTVVRGDAVHIYRPQFNANETNRVMRAPASHREDRSPRQVAERRKLDARHEQERAKLEQRKQSSPPRVEKRPDAGDDRQLQKQEQKLTERQQQERRKLEQRQSRERQQEGNRTRRR